MTRILSLAALLLIWSGFTPVFAGKYMGESADAQPVRELLTELERYQAKFQHLLEMRDEIERRQAELDEEKRTLAAESQAARKDRARVDAGEMSEQDLVAKWHESGRSLRNDREVKEFKRKVARFNERIAEYNDLTRELSPYLKDRSVADLRELVASIDELRAILVEALKEGNYVKAQYIAQNSQIAAEFGYSSN